MAYELKTRETATDVSAFLAKAEPPQRAADGQTLCTLMAQVSGQPAKLWGSAIVGFGGYRYRYASGHEGEMCRMGFSPRKTALVLYLSDCPERAGLLARLGRHTTGKGCLYIKALADVDAAVLEELLAASWRADPRAADPRAADPGAADAAG